jgi:hypothetical protein
MISILLTVISIGGCATVPKEVVELSYTVGQDMASLHSSYRTLVQQHFQSLRDQTLTFLNNRWIPTYLNDFIQNGELIRLAQNTDPIEVFDGVSAWVEVAIEEIENKKNELLTPIDQDEKSLLMSVDDAFSRIIQANATVTAHLNSIRKVQEVQDETLKALKLKDIRDQINQQLALASEKTQGAIEKIEKTDASIKKADEKKQELIRKWKGE